MAWTLPGLAARAVRAAGGPRVVLSEPNAASAARVYAAAADRPDVMARASARRFASLSVADRRAIDVAFEHMAADAAVVERAVASGAPVSSIAALAGTWERLDEQARNVVRRPLGLGSVGPVRWGETAVRQVDATTCGAAVAALVLMVGDPFVAMWVAAGARRGVEPHEAPRATLAQAAAPGTDLRTIEARWAALQRVLHTRATARGLGLAPWPRAWGTPPWRIDNVIRYAGLRWRGALIDDARPDEMAGFLTYARAALADGIPVPLYVGGDSRRGVATVMPRHVVLLTAVDGDIVRVYEPSRGEVGAWDPAAVGEPHAAFGGWNRVMWAILPRWRGA